MPCAAEDEVIPLVTCDDNGFQVHEAALKCLREIHEPIGVVVAAGKFRTGKSFLLNRICDTFPEYGFGVGSTVQACTRGIWMLKRMLCGEMCKIVVLDTEGISSLDVDSAHDMRILTLALLYSSTFIFNSVGHIDDGSLQTLGLLQRVCLKLRSQSSESISEIPPDFIWILRDFSLRLANEEGKSINEEEYLEDALRERGGCEDKDLVRKCIKDEFATRKLFTFPLPTRDDNTQIMEQKPLVISPKFTENVKTLRQQILKHTKPLVVKGTPLTGPMFVALCTELVNVVRSNAIPTMRSTWSMLADVHAREESAKILASLQARVEKLTKTPRPRLQRLLHTFDEECISSFDASIMRPLNESIEREFRAQVTSVLDNALERLGSDVDADIDTFWSHVANRQDKSALGFQTQYYRAYEVFQNAYGTECSDACAWYKHAVERMIRTEIFAIEKSLREDFDAQASKLIDEREEAVKQEANTKLTYLQLQQEVESLKQERETMVSVVPVSLVHNDDVGSPPPVLDEYEDSIEPLKKQVMEIQEELGLKCGTINSQKAQLEDANSKRDELISKLDVLNQTFESSKEEWKTIIERVQEDANNTIAKLQQNMISQLEQKDRALRQLEECRSAEKEDSDRKISDLQSDCKVYNRQLERLEVTVTSGRKETGEAHDRVLEIHKSMLDALREKDAKDRSRQQDFMQERGRLQAQLVESEILKSENRSLKRRVGTLEHVEADAKKLRVADKEASIALTRIETENACLQKEMKILRDDLHKCRATVSDMENKNVVLEAEKNFLKFSETYRSQ